MVKRLFLVSAVAFSITALGHYYIYVRLLKPLPMDVQVAGISILTVLWALTFFGFALVRAVPGSLRRFIELPMFLWMGIAYIVLLTSFITFPLDIAFRIFGSSDAQIALAIGVSLATLLVAAWALYNALRKEAVIETVIPIRSSLSKNLENLSVVVLSDIHVSGLIGKRRMRRVAKAVNALKPDLIFVTGDIVDGSVGQLKHQIFPLSDMKPRIGTYYVTGNHEYYCNAPKWKKFVADKLHWNVLSNDAACLVIDDVRINILGVEDRAWLHHARKLGETHDVRFERAEEKVPTEFRETALNILLAHQPKDTRFLAKAAWVDLQVSGHTHGGQLWPLEFFVHKDQTYNRGLYRLPAGNQLYVTQGTGFWGPPFRLGTRCEISLLKFSCSETSS